MGSLEGVLVADFSRVLAGPYCTMLLGDLGARVVKVEPPYGDDTRHWGPPWTADGQSTYYQSINRNKSSLVLDLRDPEDHELARRLVARADVLIENFRSGTMERLGLGYDDVRADNPGIVYCSITGFGSAAGAGMPGYDLVVQAVSGLISLTGTDSDHLTKTGIATADVLTGLHSALGIKHPGIAPYEPFPTADRPLVIAAGNDGLFRRLCDCLGLPHLPDDPRFASNAARVEHRDELAALLEPILLDDNADAWFAKLTEAGVPCGPINDVAQGMELAASLGLDPVVDVHGSAQVANPLRFSQTPVAYGAAPPGLDADAADLREWLSRDPS